jgi:hypothetical protein
VARLRKLIPFLAVLIALAIATLTTFALGGTERAPTQVPPLATPRLAALWDADGGGRTAARANSDEETAVEDDAPTMNVLAAGGLPEEPNRHDLELAMDKIKKRLETCQSLEQFIGTVQVRVIIERSGNVKSANALPPLDQTQTGQCIVKEVKHASFPRFRGTLTPSVELIYPVYFRPADN